MKNSKCIYIKAFYYAFIYLCLVFVGFASFAINTMFSLESDILSIIGFGALVVPTVPFQGLLYNLGMMTSNYFRIIPSDAGVLLSHAIWFCSFYALYLAFLKWQNCVCKKK